MLNSFLNTGLWSTYDYENEDNLDDKYCISDIDDNFKTECQVFIDDFMIKAKHLFTLEELEDETVIAHNLWLTIEGHGAGFWDGDYKNGDELTEICKELVKNTEQFGEKLNDNINR